MRNLAGIALILITIWGCGKNNTDPAPVYTSVDGIWTYTTPDKLIKVEFELKTVSGVLEIMNSTMVVSGIEGEGAGHLSTVNLPAIGEIRVNANDAALIYDYEITFTNCSVNSAFSFISAGSASYSYPSGLKSLSGITITRK